MRTILVVYGLMQHPLRSTVEDHLYSFRRYSRARVFYANALVGPVPGWMRRIRFDAIVFHTSFLSSLRWGPQVDETLRARALELADLPGVRAAMPQDEFLRSGALCDFIRDARVDVVFSVSPASEWPKIYAGVDRERVRFEPTLTGYLDERTLTRIDEIVRRGARAADRRLLPGRRRAALPRPARDAQDRYRRAPARPRRGRVGSRPTSRLDPGATLLGDDWFRALADARWTLGVEGGASILDPDGEIRAATMRYVAEHPDATYDEIEAACFPGRDGELALFAISPRHLEACATRPGRSSSRAATAACSSPGRHYLPLRADLSDLGTVLEQAKDEDGAAQLTERAYQDVVASGRYTYRGFARAGRPRAAHRPGAGADCRRVARGRRRPARRPRPGLVAAGVVAALQGPAAAPRRPVAPAGAAADADARARPWFRSRRCGSTPTAARSRRRCRCHARACARSWSSGSAAPSRGATSRSRSSACGRPPGRRSARPPPRRHCRGRCGARCARSPTLVGPLLTLALDQPQDRDDAAARPTSTGSTAWRSCRPWRWSRATAACRSSTTPTTSTRTPRTTRASDGPTVGECGCTSGSSALFVRFAAERVTVGAGVKELQERHFGRPFEVLHNAHDHRLDRTTQANVREALGLGDDAFLIVAAGNSKEGTAFEPIFDALAALPEHVHLAFVGRNYDAPAALAHERGIDGRVHFLPPVPPARSRASSPVPTRRRSSTCRSPRTSSTRCRTGSTRRSRRACRCCTRRRCGRSARSARSTTSACRSILATRTRCSSASSVCSTTRASWSGCVRTRGRPLAGQLGARGGEAERARRATLVAR